MSGSIISMTGFGRSTVELDGATVQAEVKSFNHRFLKVVTRLPGEISFAEGEVRKEIAAVVSRGQVEVTVKLTGAPAVSSYKLNEEAFQSHYHEWQEVKRDLNISTETPMEALLRLPDVWVESGLDERSLEKLAGLAVKAVKEAMDKLATMRRKEGEATRKDLLSIGADLKKSAVKIRKMWPEARKSVVERLRPMVAELVASEGGQVGDGIEREIIQLADRSDVSEELTRLESHLDQYLTTLEEGGVVGRRLEFLLQEMHREVNTIASKSLIAKINTEVVDAKVLVERGREQVQNVE